MPPCARLRRCLLAAALSLLPVPAARAAEPFTILGCGVTGRPLVLRDDLVLETTGLESVVRDFARWDAPAWVGWRATGDPFPWSGAVADGGLVVAFHGEPGPWPVGFAVHDYRDPAAPAARAVVAGLPARAAWLRGRALLVDAGTALIAYDLSEPATPQFTAFVPVAAAADRRCFAEAGGMLFLRDGAAGAGAGALLRALDVGDPLRPLDRGPVTLADERCDALAGGRGALYGLVVTGDRLDLVAWAVEPPAPLRETARLPLAAGPGVRGGDLVRSGDLLVAAAGGSGVFAFDVAEPARPAPGWRLGQAAERVALAAHAVFMEAPDGLYVYDRTPAARAPAGPRAREPLPALALVAGDAPAAFAQLPGDPAVLLPLDLSDPTRPRAGKPVPTELTGPLQCAGDRGLLRANVAEARLLDLSEPGAPVVRGRVTLPWPSSRALLLSRELVIVDHDYGLDRAIDFIDITDPDRPRRASTLRERHALPTGGEWLVCGGGGSRHRDDPRVYKLDGAAQPALVGALPTLLENVRLARAVGDCVYLFGEDDHGTWWLEVHQVRDAARPTRLHAQPLGGPAVAVESRGALLLVQGDSDCRTWDVSDPHRPQPAGALPAPALAGAGFARAGDVLVASGRLLAVGPTGAPGAAAAAPVTAPAAAGVVVRLEPARPNPANGGARLAFTLDRARDLALTVYDVRGCLVRELAAGRFEAGPHAVDWDGRTAGGAAAASGTYFARLHGPGVEAVQSVTLVR